MHMPAIVRELGLIGRALMRQGRWVAETLENSLDPEYAELFRWRPEESFNGNLKNALGRTGGLDVVTDLTEITEWTTIPEGLSDECIGVSI
jgi:hypothetical protein